MSVEITLPHFTFAVLVMAMLLSCNDLVKHSDSYYDDYFNSQSEIAGSYGQEKAMANIDSLYNKTPSPSSYFKYKRLTFKSGYYYTIGEKKLARKYADSVLDLLESNKLTNKYPSEYARALYTRGDFYFTDNEIDSAFAFFSHSREISIALKDNDYLIGRQSYHLGMISYRQEKYKEATLYFKQAFDGISTHKVDSNHYYWLQEILNNTALSYTKLGLNDSARIYYINALKYIETEGAKYSYSARQKKMAEVATGVITGNLAKVYMAKGINDTAEQLLLKSLAINSKPGYDNYDATATSIQLAELYYYTKRPQEAYKILQQLRPALDKIHNTDAEMRWRKLMCNYYLDQKQIMIAGKYMESFLALKDSMNTVGKKLNKVDYGQLLKQQDSLFQLRLLKKDKELKQLYLWITIGFAILAIIISSLIATNYRRSRKNVITLTSLNNRINEQNAALAKALKDISSSNEDKDRILQTVAHDLRNPISAVAMIGGLLATTEDNEVKKKELNIIVRASHSMLTLTEELLKFSSGASEENQDNKELIDIKEIVMQVVSLLQFKAEEKNQEINLITPPGPVNSYVSREQITRIFSNLVSNAIKFSRKNSGIEISLQIINNNIQIKVTDNGIGIPREFLTKIFDPFTQAKRHGTAGERSFGLGLSICKQIVEDHKGRIWATSTEGKGSTFFVELPLA